MNNLNSDPAKFSSVRRAALFALLALLPGRSYARQLVTLVNGSQLEVESLRQEGSRIMLSLPGGGEVGIPSEQVSGIAPAPPAPAPPTAPVEPPQAAAPAPAGKSEVRISPWDPEPGVRALIGEMALTMGLDAKLVEAVVEAESKFDPYAVSRKGAMGLMQLMPQTARHYQVKDVFDPRQNLEGGMRYLKFLLTRYEDTALALAAYNAGEDVVDRYRGVPPYRETRGYVARILRRLKT